jgi:hypothetical protein
MPKNKDTPAETTEAMAKQAPMVVEKVLGLSEFINNNWDNIYRRLEESELRVMKAIEEKKIAPEDEHLLFLYETLPFIGGIVRVGSNLHNYDKGVEWVNSRLPHTEPHSVLAALTFFYIVDKAWPAFCDSQEWVEVFHVGKAQKKEIWERIRERVEKHVSPDSFPLYSPPPIT